MTELRSRDRGLYILITILFLYTVVFSGVAIWRYEHFLYHDSGDLLLFEQVVHNTSHGKPFYNNFSQQNHFGDHNSPILALLVPLSLIFPVPYVLYFFTVLSISVSAIPIYLISRELLCSEATALLLTVGYLMLPTFVGQVYLSFHEMNLVLPFLTFAFYYFIKERFYAFITMFIMGMLVKEDVSLTLFMFAPYAAIKKKDRKWIIIPASLSIIWFFLSIKVIIPFFNKQDSYGMAFSYFSNLGSSLSEIVINTVNKPLNTLEIIFRPEKLHYVFILLIPLCLILPFFSIEILFAIPSIFFNMLAGTQRFRFITCITDSDTVFFPRHMSLMAAVFLFIATMYTIKKASSFFPEKKSKHIMLGLTLLVIALILYSDKFIISKYFYQEDPKIIKYMPTPDSIKKVLALIPYDSTVKANIKIANHLYDRKEAYYHFDNPVASDYIIITRLDTSKFDITQITRMAKEYKLIASEDNIGLYKKIDVRR